MYDFPMPVFSETTISEIVRLAKTICVNSFLGFSWIWGTLGPQKIDDIGFVAQGHVQKSRNPENEGLGVLP